MKKRTSILIADDEAKIRKIIINYLNPEEFFVGQAGDGLEALELFHSSNWDLVILDIMMPNKDGIKVCQEIRHVSKIPVILLTGLSDETSRIMGLEIGADDYIGKPFSPRELVSRIKAILRRTALPDTTEKSVINLQDMVIDLLSRTVTVGDKYINLTPKEFDILALMARNQCRIFTREILLHEVWGTNYYGNFRTVDTLIKRLRKRLKSAGVPSYINTVWGVGYKFEVSE